MAARQTAIQSRNQRTTTRIVRVDPIESDKWDLALPPYREWITTRDCEGVWRFASFGESPVKAEIKLYLKDNVSIKTSATVAKYRRTIELIGQFVSQELAGRRSILDLTEREVVQRFEAYVAGRGISPTREKGSTASDVVRMLRALYVHTALSSPHCDLLRLDTWPTERMPVWIVPHPGLKSSKPVRILFRRIPQEGIASDCKRWALHMLKSYSAQSVTSDITSLTTFFRRVFEADPSVVSTADLRRENVTDFMGWVNDGGCSAQTGGSALSALRRFLGTIKLMGLEVPAKPIVYKKDRFKQKKKDPEYFSRAEQRRLIRHLDDLEQPYRRMLTVHYQVGMRASELCLLTEGCLKRTVEGTWYLDYFQYKTKKPNSVPVTPEVKEAITLALQESKREHGPGCRYVFANGVDMPVTRDEYERALERYVKRNGVYADDRTLLNVRTHKFRSTVATNMINNPGIDDPYLVAMYLGQVGLGQLDRYAAIHGSTMMECLAPITERDEMFIRSLGQAEVASPDLDEMGLPLCNGRCLKPADSGKCDSYNACYGCAMFKPSRDSLDIFEHQLAEVEKRIVMAEANGFDRILEMNMVAKKQLEDIISKIKK